MDHLKEGYGREVYFDGSYYEGQFKEGQKDDFGKYSWSDGDKYIG